MRGGQPKQSRNAQNGGVTQLRGFILQSSYRLVPFGDGRRRAVLHVHGRLESGATFLVRDDRQRPNFFIGAADVERASALRAPRAQASEYRSIDGRPVCRVELDAPPDVAVLRDRLQAAGIDTFEADVRFAVRYLIERGIKGGCEIEGTPLPGDGAGVDWVIDNPTLTPAQVDIEPRILSFDIETYGKSERLLAISWYAPDVDAVLIVDGSERPMPDNAIRCEDEYAALDAFCKRVQSFDPDVLTGLESHRFRS